MEGPRRRDRRWLGFGCCLSLELVLAAAREWSVASLETPASHLTRLTF